MSAYLEALVMFDDASREHGHMLVNLRSMTLDHGIKKSTEILVCVGTEPAYPLRSFQAPKDGYSANRCTVEDAARIWIISRYST
jgi:hypothetical protein